MTHLIDKSAIMAEINNRIDGCTIKKQSCPVNTQVESICDNKIHAYKEILSYIESLEVKEVDLKKELDEYFDTHDNEFLYDDYLELAKHFYELCLKVVQKGE